MTQPEFLKGFAVFAIVIGAAWLSMPYVDRYVEAVAPVKAAGNSANGRRAAGGLRAERWIVQELPWPNVPTLSPPCAPEK